jgi:predicted nucleic-acid-binding Zn-ribbon protein
MEPIANFDLVTCPKCGNKPLITEPDEYYFDALRALRYKQNTFIQIVDCHKCKATFSVKFVYQFLTIQG